MYMYFIQYAVYSIYSYCIPRLQKNIHQIYNSKTAKFADSEQMLAKCGLQCSNCKDFEEL